LGPPQAQGFSIKERVNKTSGLHQNSAVSALVLGAPSQSLEGEVFASRVSNLAGGIRRFVWPDGARLVGFHIDANGSGAQPLSGAESMWDVTIKEK